MAKTSTVRVTLRPHNNPNPLFHALPLEFEADTVWQEDRFFNFTKNENFVRMIAEDAVLDIQFSKK